MQCDAKISCGQKGAKKILIVGQCKEEPSVAFSCSKINSNIDLIKMARFENPEAELIYVPSNKEAVIGRRSKNNLGKYYSLCKVINPDLPVSQILKGIDHVYTIASLLGFEALMRDIKVTTTGCPFYGGWGVTDTRQSNQRRTRELSSLEIFAATYILYPIYVHPKSNKICDVEDIVCRGAL